MDEDFVDRVHVCIISDGFEKLSEDYLINLEAVGIHDMTYTENYKVEVVTDGKTGIKVVYRPLNFINRDNMCEGKWKNKFVLRSKHEAYARCR